MTAGALRRRVATADWYRTIELPGGSVTPGEYDLRETARGRPFPDLTGRRDHNAYALDPGQIGRFDFAIVGTLLLHLRDPIGALMAVRRVLEGPLIANEVVSLSRSLLRPRSPMASLMTLGAPFWWIRNCKGLERHVTAAGYELGAAGGPYLPANGPGSHSYRTRNRRSPVQAVRWALFRRGAPHAWVPAEPRR